MEAPEVKAQRLLEQYYNMKEGHEDPTPEGYVSIDEIMKVQGCCRAQVFRMMGRMEKAGKVHRIALRKMRGKRLTVVTYFK
jgi:predicted transcriptional regulator of viral defense system